VSNALPTTVCAIVPTYDRASLLPECLESLFAQTRPLDQIVVVNDGSTDNTEQVLRAYADRIRVLRQNNAGKAAALNTALTLCENDYVWICDDDDIAEPDACAALAGALDANRSAAFSYGHFRRFRDVDGTREILPMSYWPNTHEQEFFLALLERCFVFQFSSMIRRSAYQNVGPFDATLLQSEDYDMMLRLARHHSGTYVDKRLFLQRIHAGSRGSATDRFASELSIAKRFEYDRIIFKRLRDELTLEEMTPLFARSLSANEAQRAAVLERACIAGRHAMWSECIADLEQACALSPVTPASLDEQAIARRTLSEPDAVPYLAAETPLARRLRSVLRSCEFGRSIANPLASPLFWQIRGHLMARQTTSAWRHLRLLIALIGGRRALARGLMLGLRRLGPRYFRPRNSLDDGRASAI
jgi:GT2 family glycosyltransferase